MKRNIIDAVMLAGLLLALNYRYTENSAHELIGVGLGVLFIWHCWLNIGWFKSLRKLKAKPVPVTLTALNLLLLAAMLAVIITGLLISQSVLPNRLLRNSLLVHDIHSWSAYTMLILGSLHLGFHWQGLWLRFCRRLGIGYTGAFRLAARFAAAVAAVYGVWASVQLQIGERLLMRHIFIDWNAEPQLWQPLVEYLAVCCLYAWLADAVFSWLRQRSVRINTVGSVMKRETA